MMEHVNQPSIICPHCGHEDHDSWEIDFGPGCEGETTIECSDCDKPFFATRYCDVTYSTAKVQPKTPEAPHGEREG